MSLNDELTAYVKETHRAQWTTTEGRTVPDLEDLTLGNRAKKIDATVLYADLAESTNLVEEAANWFAAEVYKNYLYCAAKIIRARGGEVTAYDGDRVMGVFVGDSKNTSAAKCALQINYAARKVIQPAIERQYPQADYTLKHKVGVDTSTLFVARTGIRGSNDLVWVGTAANNAAKMATLPTTYASYISSAVYNNMHESSKLGGGEPKKDMWTRVERAGLGYMVLGSNWTWSI